MSTSSNGLPDDRTRVALAALAPEPPAWAVEHFADALPGRTRIDDWRLVGTQIPECGALDAATLERAVGDAYRVLAASLQASGHHPVRFWNFVPGIHADMGGGRDRYMVFNAGRYAAFEEWFGQAALFTRTVPTASAVGIGSGALTIHALGGRDAGLPVENPRQVPAYRYSSRYGPLPPCFARGTIVRGLATPVSVGADAPVLLVGGTASIVGEHSLHDRDARQQALETFENLAELVVAARRQIGGATGHDAPRAAFDAFTELRVYVVRDTDAPLLREMVSERFGRTARIEFAQADLCRRELLVEIEGVATL
ncbi:MAG: pteridine-dependent deoxygenase like protein [Vicinamibacteraceae bacterium]